jgi:hypothetical protein
VAVTVTSALRATVLPRDAHGGLVRLTFSATRLVFRARIGRSATYERRDKVMAMLGPVSLLVLLASWLLLAIAGYTMMFVATGASGLGPAVEMSGSSIFTLGTSAPHGLGSGVLAYSEAGIGLLLVTLLITYLPSIYGAFSRRENGVNLLRVRAGEPPRAATLLIRYHRIDPAAERITLLWQMWEAWFTDVEETHTTFSVLPFFRSPQSAQSWVTAAGVLLDSASMWVAAVDHAPDPDAQLCIRTGFQALRRIASVYGLDLDRDPQPDDPIAIGRNEWDASLAELVAAGVAVKADREAAWAAWRGWRVNYDTVLLTLARLVEAPPADWVSDRSPIGAGPKLRRRHLRRPPAVRSPGTSDD